MTPDSNKMTLYMGDLEPWMDENYLKQLWLSMGENVNIKMIRDKVTGGNAGYCFVDFMNHGSALKYLNSINGTLIPGTNRVFKLNWAAGTQNSAPEYSVFVGDLGPEITDFMLLQKFQSRYSNCKSAKVVTDPVTGASRGYGFVRFSDENEKQRALIEMDGQYCGSRAMRISVATPKNKVLNVPPVNKPSYSNMSMNMMGSNMRGDMNVGVDPSAVCYNQQSQSYNQFSDPHNTTVFVGGLNTQITDEELKSYFAPFGDIIYTKIPPGKGCGFVQFVHRQSAEMAIRQMNGFIIGSSGVRLSWGRSQAASKGHYRPYMLPVNAQQPPPAQQYMANPAPQTYPKTSWTGYAQNSHPNSRPVSVMSNMHPYMMSVPSMRPVQQQIPLSYQDPFPDQQQNNNNTQSQSLVDQQNYNFILNRIALMQNLELTPPHSLNTLSAGVTSE